VFYLLCRDAVVLGGIFELAKFPQASVPLDGQDDGGFFALVVEGQSDKLKARIKKSEGQYLARLVFSSSMSKKQAFLYRDSKQGIGTGERQK
jgi:hypothetical protein